MSPNTFEQIMLMFATIAVGALLAFLLLMGFVAAKYLIEDSK